MFPSRFHAPASISFDVAVFVYNHFAILRRNHSLFFGKPTAMLCDSLTCSQTQTAADPCTLATVRNGAFEDVGMVNLAKCNCKTFTHDLQLVITIEEWQIVVNGWAFSVCFRIAAILAHAFYGSKSPFAQHFDRDMAAVNSHTLLNALKKLEAFVAERSDEKERSGDSRLHFSSSKLN